MAQSIWFSVGRRALQRRHQTGLDQSEPPGLRGDGLEQWRLGYGGKGIECVSLPVVKEARTIPPPRDARPYTAFSTKATKRRAMQSDRSSQKQSGKRPGYSQLPSSRRMKLGSALSTRSFSRSQTCSNDSKASVSVTKSVPQSQLDLWGNVIDPVEAKGSTGGPVIPLVEMDARRNELAMIGIGISLAETLVAKNWTLDQLTVQVLIPIEDAEHPKCVQEALPIVARHVESLRKSFAK